MMLKHELLQFVHQIVVEDNSMSTYEDKVPSQVTSE